MNGRERGFLLLTSHLGDPVRKVLTVPQLRVLARAITDSHIPKSEGEVGEEDLMRLGFNRPSAQRILQLLSEEEQLDWYLNQGGRSDCLVLTRISEGFPVVLRRRLGLDCPGALWLKGDPTLLRLPAISLVGSRDLKSQNQLFAREVGRQAALQGFVLISGNARGADSVAQQACLEAGGKVISVVADRLCDHPIRDRVLYLSEDGFDLPFSAQRALSRNRVIHCLGQTTLVAQCTLGKGGTWNGTVQNLQKGWSAVCCFDDGSDAAAELSQRGAQLLRMDQLDCLLELKKECNLLES